MPNRATPIDHVSVGSNDIAKAREFYCEVLATLGLNIVDEVAGRYVDFGNSGVAFSVETPVDGRQAVPGNGSHIAFSAKTRLQVDEFHRAAIAAGGVDEGSPGPRPEHGEHYYGAFVRDLDGNKIEAVCQAAPSQIE